MRRLGSDGLEILGGAEHRHPLDLPLLLPGVVVEVADDGETILAVSLKTLDQPLAEISRADHQDHLEIAAGTTDPTKNIGDQPPGERDQHRVDPREDRQEKS